VEDDVEAVSARPCLLAAKLVLVRVPHRGSGARARAAAPALSSSPAAHGRCFSPAAEKVLEHDLLGFLLLGRRLRIEPGRY